METKMCKRCGIERPIDQFRRYYNRTKGLYSFCKTCERIEQRRKYLVAKDAVSRDGLSSNEQQELDKIEELYEYHTSCGRAVPGKRKASHSVIADIEDIMNK